MLGKQTQGVGWLAQMQPWSYGGRLVILMFAWPLAGDKNVGQLESRRHPRFYTQTYVVVPRLESKGASHYENYSHILCMLSW